MGLFSKIKKIVKKPISDAAKVVNKTGLSGIVSKYDPLTAKLLGIKPGASSAGAGSGNQFTTGGTIVKPLGPDYTGNPGLGNAVQAPNAGRLSAYNRASSIANPAAAPLPGGVPGQAGVVNPLLNNPALRRRKTNTAIRTM